MSVPLVVLCAFFLLIMIRQIGPVRLQIWQIMTGGTLTFLEFARAGVPLTILNVLVYWVFLRFL